MEECLECKKLFPNKLKLSFHIRFFHKTSMPEYRDKYQILKCTECGENLWAYNKSGYCENCFDYSANSLKLWQTPSYRNTIIDAVSKPRRKGFGKEQSKRMKDWWDAHPERKDAQRKHMKKSWRDGKIIATPHSINRSSGEKALYKDIASMFMGVNPKATIRVGSKWFFPDILLEAEGIIIEYFGDYWYANPKIYAAEDVVRWGITAYELWFNDKKRLEALASLGYKIEIVYQTDYREDREEILKRFDSLFNWESCVL